MFNATFLIATAEGLDAARRADLVATFDDLGQKLGCAHIIGDVLPKVAYQAGDINFEVSFADRAAYEGAKETAAWAQVKELVADTSLVDYYQFAAYGADLLNVTDRDGRSGCHRWLFHHCLDGVDAAKLDKAMYGTLHMQDYVEGFNNSLVARTVESEGTATWDVVFECDFDDVDVYAFPYENHAVHTGYITRYWDAVHPDGVFSDYCCTTSAVATDGPYVHLNEGRR